MLAARQLQGIDDAVHIDLRPFDPKQFGIQKSDVEVRVVNDEHVLADKLEERRRDMDKQGFVFEELCADAVHGLGFGWHIAFGINETMILAARWHAVHEFDAADFNQPVAFGWIKAGCFRIEYDFTRHI